MDFLVLVAPEPEISDLLQPVASADRPGLEGDGMSRLVGPTDCAPSRGYVDVVNAWREVPNMGEVGFHDVVLEERGFACWRWVGKYKDGDTSELLQCVAQVGTKAMVDKTSSHSNHRWGYLHGSPDHDSNHEVCFVTQTNRASRRMLTGVSNHWDQQ